MRVLCPRPLPFSWGRLGPAALAGILILVAVYGCNWLGGPPMPTRSGQRTVEKAGEEESPRTFAMEIRAYARGLANQVGDCLDGYVERIDVNLLRRGSIPSFMNAMEDRCRGAIKYYRDGRRLEDVFGRDRDLDELLFRAAAFTDAYLRMVKHMRSIATPEIEPVISSYEVERLNVLHHGFEVTALAARISEWPDDHAAEHEIMTQHLDPSAYRRKLLNIQQEVQSAAGELREAYSQFAYGPHSRGEPFRRYSLRHAYAVFAAACDRAESLVESYQCVGHEDACREARRAGEKIMEAAIDFKDRYRDQMAAFRWGSDTGGDDVKRFEESLKREITNLLP